ncbi:transcriptional regulator putative [Dehalogenimonas sp. WBC-2]|nr:transcriptional regulator putative [Dehalogenimonas sp. WBC-2]
MEPIASFSRKHTSRLIYGLAIVALLGAGVYGQLSHGLSGNEEFLSGAMPEAATFKSLQTSGGATLYLARDTAGTEMGYITASEGPGYGGPLKVLVNWTPDGIITAVTVPDHHEDLPWWNVLIKQDFFGQYVGRSFSEPLQLFNDIDASTGSTVSCNGVAVGVRSGRLVMAQYLGQPYNGPADPIIIGRPELTVAIGLLAVVLARIIPGLRRRAWPRVITLIYGFVVLGIWLAIPLSLTNIASWLVGYAPHLQTFFVMYIIVFGVIGLAVIFGKNFYCFWLCPYVAVQELLYAIFRIRVQPDGKWFKILRNARYILLFIALFLVLALKNPSVSVFEPWNVLFSLKGTTDQWVLMFFSLGVAIFIYDFWCHYLCPVGAVMDVILKGRRGVIGLWQKSNNKTRGIMPPTTS